MKVFWYFFRFRYQKNSRDLVTVLLSAFKNLFDEKIYFFPISRKNRQFPSNRRQYSKCRIFLLYNNQGRQKKRQPTLQRLASFSVACRNNYFICPNFKNAVVFFCLRRPMVICCHRAKIEIFLESLEKLRFSSMTTCSFVGCTQYMVSLLSIF